MSFSGDIKKELLRQLPAARHCQIAELAALFDLVGRVRQDESGSEYLEIHTENLTVARKSYMLLISVFHDPVEVLVRNHNIRGNIREYYIIVRNRQTIISMLKALKMMDEQGRIAVDCLGHQHRLIQNTCCKRAFLRGVFLAAGSLSDPEKAYHLEFALFSEQFASFIKDILAFFELEAKIVRRKRYFVVYIKEGSQIVDFLNVVEAHIALMEFENVRIVKEVRNSVNRQVNCETANIGKTVAAAAKQIEDIEFIECNMGLRKLARGLREIAELRLEYPDASLQELGKMLDPPIGKSGVNHRLRKLGIIANELKEES
ncbi:MAG: DNA-binding protein WhiA [Lachnospiraceae bacterium]|nr:DNA-binding protein WhiA [Lachnospiraceae bacterium]